MKKVNLFTLSLVLILGACSPKAKKSTATTAAPVTDSFEANLTAIKPKFPNATIDELKKGHTIYYTGACTRCHSPKDIERRDEKEWVEVMNKMAPKAKLTPEERDVTWKYIMSVKMMQAK
jgi:hypothetical protein